MIIKFQEKDKWVMFGEIDHIEYRFVKNITEEQVPEDRGLPVTDQIIDYDAPNDNDIHALCEVSFFTKNTNEVTVIRCFSPIYIMNDNGRTVETI